MAPLQDSPIFTRIKNARSYSDHVAALRSLKNEVTGHGQRKELWVEGGILEPIVKTLQASRVGTSPNGRDGHAAVAKMREMREDESVRLQALQLLAIFTNGGPSFLDPIRSAGAIPVIMSNIFPLDNHPHIVLTALRALNSIAEAATLASPPVLDAAALAEIMFSPPCLDAFNSILYCDARTMVEQEQKQLVAGLIGTLCWEEKHQNAMANRGVLDSLATALASFVVARGEVVPGAEVLGAPDGLAELIPHAVPRGLGLAPVLRAISAIISDSRFRTCMLICSPAIMAVFPNAGLSPPGRKSRAAWDALEMTGLRGPRVRDPGALDYLLPAVPLYHLRSMALQAAQFPPRGFYLARGGAVLNRGINDQENGGGRDTTRSGAHQNTNEDADSADEEESPLVPWLIHLVRSSGSLERVMAASVLASLFKAGFASPEREAAIGGLVVPVLCDLVKEAYMLATTLSSEPNSMRDPRLELSQSILQTAPSVLARLVSASELLQKCAYDCGILKTARNLLADTYEPIREQSPSTPWTPTPAKKQDGRGGTSALRAGCQTRLPLYSHRVKLRESTLKLIAAMVSLKEEYRKALVEQNGVPYVAASLVPFPTKVPNGKDQSRSDMDGGDDERARTEALRYGFNTNSVLIGACHVVRLLSRSVSILRTSIEDFGVAPRIFKLLRHSDKQVQVAASGASCNLVLEMSPMRQSLIELGIVKVLCEHAHSRDPELRHNAMWALKHLVLEADNVLKRRCLDEIQPGWLVQLVCDHTEDDALFSRLGQEREAHDGDDDGDQDMDVEDSDEESTPWLWPALYRTRSAVPRDQSQRMQRAESRLTALREAELDAVGKAQNDDLAIQEQGLNFIRNLIGPPDSSSSGPDSSNDLTEMVDYVLAEIGQDRLFEILASKLQVKVLHAFSRRHGRGRGARVLYPQPRVVEAVVGILVHVAASIPRHRQLVIAQAELLRLLGGFFHNKDGGVRRALCHLMANLAWRDDQDDAVGCTQRALELKKLGFLSKLELLEQDDGELDVRERARAAAWSLKQSHQ